VNSDYSKKDIYGPYFKEKGEKGGGNDKIGLISPQRRGPGLSNAKTKKERKLGEKKKKNKKKTQASDLRP